MAELRIGDSRYPLVMTVAVLDDMAGIGYTFQDVPKYFSPADHPLEDAVANGIDFLHQLMEAGQDVAVFQGAGNLPAIPDRGLLREMLTPGQVWGLCDAAIVDSLRRTVEADPGKNAIHAVPESP